MRLRANNRSHDSASFAALLILLLCAFCAVSQAQANDKSLMTDAEYKSFLLQIEAVLPKEETALRSIDLEKDPQISYSQGKSIADKRDLCLRQIDGISRFIAMQRNKHTVYGELALKELLDTLFGVKEEMMFEGAFNEQPLTRVQKDANELSALIARLRDDAMERVKLLEKGTCP
jgi:hypothetical protein